MKIKVLFKNKDLMISEEDALCMEFNNTLGNKNNYGLILVAKYKNDKYFITIQNTLNIYLTGELLTPEVFDNIITGTEVMALDSIEYENGETEVYLEINQN